MASDRQTIIRFKKFVEVPGLDKELDSVIKQIQDKFGVIDTEFGGLYIHNDDTVTVTIASGGTYYAVTGFKTGEYNQVEMNSAYMRIQESGTYRIGFYIIADHDTANTEVEFVVYKNGTAIERLDAEITVLNANDEVNFSVEAFVSLKRSDKLELKVTANNTGDVIIYDANFNIERIK